MRLRLDDIETFGVLLVVGVVAWVTPSRWWGAIASAMARLTTLTAGRPQISMPREAARMLGETWSPEHARAARAEAAAAYFEDRLQILGSLRPFGWRPDVTLAGREHLDAALAEGHGAILWVAEFSGSDLMAKFAVNEAGYRVAHLSRPTHGFSETPLGIRFANPLRTRVEDRHLDERLTIRDDNTVGALRPLRRRLKANGIVSITVGDIGQRSETVPFRETGIRLATGPATLARAAGAALLPVFTTRLDGGSYEVRIDAPLTVGSGRDKEDSPALEEMARALGDEAARRPGQWRAWHLLDDRGARPREHGRS